MLNIKIEFDPGGLGYRKKAIADLEIIRDVSGGGQLYRYKLTELAAEFKKNALNCEGQVHHDREEFVWMLVEKIVQDATKKLSLN